MPLFDIHTIQYYSNGPDTAAAPWYGVSHSFRSITQLILQHKRLELVLHAN